MVLVFRFWGFSPLYINLQWVSLLWEGTEALQSLSGLAAIHPETLSTSQARAGISCKSNTSGKGQAGRSHFIPWNVEMLLQALSAGYFNHQKVQGDAN